MLKVIFKNPRGRFVEIYSAPFRLIKIEGLGDVRASIQTQKAPYQDGTTYIDATLESRPLQIELSIQALTNEDLMQEKANLLSVFNPKEGLGVLQVDTSIGKYEIPAIVEGIPYFPDGRNNRSATRQKVLIDLVAPNPYWKSIEKITESLSAFIPKRVYPSSYPVRYGSRGMEATLYNDGHVPTPIEVIFEGPAVEPTIINRTTGEFIKVRRRLEVGEKLIINTAFGHDRKIEIDKGNGVIENAWGYIDIWESTLFMLEVGPNILEHNALGGYGSVNVSFKKQYVGI